MADPRELALRAQQAMAPAPAPVQVPAPAPAPAEALPPPPPPRGVAPPPPPPPPPPGAVAAPPPPPGVDVTIGDAVITSPPPAAAGGAPRQATPDYAGLQAAPAATKAGLDAATADASSAAISLGEIKAQGSENKAALLEKRDAQTAALGADINKQLVAEQAALGEARKQREVLVKELKDIPPPHDDRTVGQRILGTLAGVLGGLQTAVSGKTDLTSQVHSTINGMIDRSMVQQQGAIDNAAKRISVADKGVDQQMSIVEHTANMNKLRLSELQNQYANQLETLGAKNLTPELQQAAQVAAANLRQQAAEGEHKTAMTMANDAMQAQTSDMVSRRAAAVQREGQKLTAKTALAQMASSENQAQMTAQVSALKAQAASGMLAVGAKVPGGLQVKDPEVVKNTPKETMNKFYTDMTASRQMLRSVEDVKKAFAETSSLTRAGAAVGLRDESNRILEQKMTELTSALAAGKGAWDNGLERLIGKWSGGTTITDAMLNNMDELSAGIKGKIDLNSKLYGFEDTEELKRADASGVIDKELGKGVRASGRKND